MIEHAETCEVVHPDDTRVCTCGRDAKVELIASWGIELVASYDATDSDHYDAAWAQLCSAVREAREGKPPAKQEPPSPEWQLRNHGATQTPDEEKGGG